MEYIFGGIWGGRIVLVHEWPQFTITWFLLHTKRFSLLKMCQKKGREDRAVWPKKSNHPNTFFLYGFNPSINPPSHQSVQVLLRIFFQTLATRTLGRRPLFHPAYCFYCIHCTQCTACTVPLVPRVPSSV